jgi:hypothetical protein
MGKLQKDGHLKMTRLLQDSNRECLNQLAIKTSVLTNSTMLLPFFKVIYCHAYIQLPETIKNLFFKFLQATRCEPWTLATSTKISTNSATLQLSLI